MHANHSTTPTGPTAHLVASCGSALLAVLAAVLSLAPAADAAPSFRLVRAAAGLVEPTWVGSPQGDGRLFVAERSGRIIMFDHGRRSVFLDIRTAVADEGGEQGLLAVAFHTNFARNHRFWIYYTVRGGDGRLVEYRAGTLRARPASARTILMVPLGREYDNHNGGQMVYHAGQLWLGIGDGGSAGDPDNNAQDRTDLRGKLLRLDVERGYPYRIPSDNPYSATSGFRQEIYALGLRNPWRIAVDAPTGDVWIGDVGQGELEEIDRLPAGGPAGANFGWGRFEGTSVYDATRLLAKGTTHREPLYEYSHDDGSCSITGGVFYRGPVRSLRGYYLYADFCRSFVGGVRRDGTGAFRRNVRVGGISSFGTGPSGHAYAASLEAGAVYRLAAA